jgi:glutaminyl-tRNA synthetase
VPAAALRSFAEMIGVTKADTRVDVGKLEYAIREELNPVAPRVMGVLRPLRMVVTNWPADRVEWLDAPSFPPDVGREGSRPLPFARELLIEEDDFRVEPVKGYRRLAPGREVRLRHGYIVRYESHETDPATGQVTLVRVTYDEASRGGASKEREVAGTIHWVAEAHATPVEVRLYERLFTVPDPDDVPEGQDFTVHLNPDSRVVLQGARVEPSVASASPGTRWQLERIGYFWADPIDSSPERMVLNQIVTLRSGWARTERAADEAAQQARQAKAAGGPSRPPSVPPAPRPAVGTDRGREQRDAVRTRDLELGSRLTRYRDALGLSPEEADLLTGDRALSDFFDAVLAVHADAKSVAAWVINELPGEAAGRALGDLAFGPAQLGRLIALVDRSEVSRIAAKEVLAELAQGGGEPEAIVERRGLRQVGDRAALIPHVEAVLAAWPDKVQEYRSGKKGLLGFFTGEVRRASGGAADPRVVRTLLEERLG